ncbi:hypothetical protein Tco_0916191 [Tanacetum coccineum]
MFSIIYEPIHGIIYNNSKKEKRVMKHSEIHKFCDATLNRVLEGLRSFNNDVKYGYIQRDLTNEEVEYLKLFKEEIESLETIFGRSVNRVIDRGDEANFSCISDRGQAPEKVTSVDLFYLRSMDWGTANILYLLAKYLFRHAEGRKSGARLSEGHFIRRLAAHFGLAIDQGLRGLSVVTRELPLIDLHELASAPKAAKDARVVDEGAQADPAPVQTPQPPHATLRTMP